MLALGSLAATAIANRIGARRLLYASFLFWFLGAGLAALARSIPVLIVSQVCLGLGLGTGYPTLMGLSIRDVANAERTIAMGLHQTIYAIGMFAGPALSGVLANAVGIRPMFALTGLACLTLGLLGLQWLAESQVEPSPGRQV